MKKILSTVFALTLVLSTLHPLNVAFADEVADAPAVEAETMETEIETQSETETEIETEFETEAETEIETEAEVETEIETEAETENETETEIETEAVQEDPETEIQDEGDDEGVLLSAGNSMSSATSISTGSTYYGSITSSNTVDYYKFTISSSGCAFCGAQRTPMRFRADAMRSITDAPKRSILLFSFSAGSLLCSASLPA